MIRLALRERIVSPKPSKSSPVLPLGIYLIGLCFSVPILSTIGQPVAPGQTLRLSIVQLVIFLLLIPLAAFAIRYPRWVYLVALGSTAIHDLWVVSNTSAYVQEALVVVSIALVFTGGLCELTHRLVQGHARMVAALEASESALRARMAELEVLHAQMAELSLRDGLTGLYNRRALDEQFLTLTNAARVADTTLCAALFDIDNFKAINDRFSHAVGDAALIGVAEILTRVIGAQGVVARYGGEEFAVILPDCALPEALLLCDVARAAIADHDWTRIDPALRVTVSGGVADNRTFPPTAKPEAQLRLADDHLYLAKAQGKNRVLAASEQSLVAPAMTATTHSTPVESVTTPLSCEAVSSLLTNR